MQSSVEPSTFSLRDLYRVLFRHKRKVVAFGILSLFLAVVAIIVLPRKYESEARLFITLGPDSAGLDTTEISGPGQTIQETTEGATRSLLDILESQVLLEMVVDEIGPEAILNPPKGPTSASTDAEAADSGGGLLSWLKAPLYWMGISDSVDQRELAIRKLRNSIHVGAEKKSRVILVSAMAGTPYMAKRTIDVFVASYFRQHPRVHRTEEAVKVLGQATRQKAADLQTSQAKLKKLRNSIGLLTIASERAAVQKRVEGLKQAILTAQQQLANVSSDNMALNITEMQKKLRDLLSRFREGHPRVQALKQQLNEAQEAYERQLKGISAGGITGTTDASLAATLKSKLKTLTQQFGEQSAKLRSLNDTSVKLETKNREVNRLIKEHSTLSQRLAQAEFRRKLVRENITNVGLIQDATLNKKAVSPRKMLILALAAFMAVVGGVGVALCCEFLDHSLKSPEEVEDKLELPVLMSIPYFERHAPSLN